ncbi:hypothetical protein ACXKU5_002846 [Yersinia enterocolitica]|uniref:DUF3168 domain-containing protein n=2 Tax=Yersinia TaxID=629 RepID=A0A0T9TP99_YERAE|nr:MULTISPECIES: hypothetical protein [Yersinia]AKF37317.1 hypothetical protein FORC2_1170 [Yersinia enterocolitica]ALG46089.1 hypothetical protein LI89_15605 [Yersinia enterocolitica]EKN4193813.1 hypothetical protein [Yersinia enterocolitica]EKN5152666.1 hypothetical protein [Yersinia enterocolitica]EKN6128091.1 hypothetical protein [Yersinia enterocolitica]
MKRFDIKTTIVELLKLNGLIVRFPTAVSIQENTYTLFSGDMSESYSPVGMDKTKYYSELDIDFVVLAYDEQLCNTILTQVLNIIIQDSTYVVLSELNIKVTSISTSQGFSNSDRDSTDIAYAYGQTIKINYIEG